MRIKVNMTSEYENFIRFQKYEELEKNYRRLCQLLLSGLKFEPVYSEDDQSKMLRAQKIEIGNRKDLEDVIIMADKWLFGRGIAEKEVAGKSWIDETHILLNQQKGDDRKAYYGSVWDDIYAFQETVPKGTLPTEENAKRLGLLICIGKNGEPLFIDEILARILKLESELEDEAD